VSELVFEVGNQVTTLVQGRIGDAYTLFKRELGWRDENYQYAVRQYAEKVRADCIRKRYSRERIEQEVERALEWDGYKSDVCYSSAHCHCYVKKSGLHFSTGLLSKARGFFDKFRIPYSLIDVRPPCPTRMYDYTMSEEYEERDYQIKVKKDACFAKRGILKIATGGGKTPTGASIIAELGVGPFVFYVTSKDLLQQAKDEIEKFVRLNGVPMKVGAVGGGQKDIQAITVMTVQTALRALGVKFEKVDDEGDHDEEDDTNIDDMKGDIRDLIRSAKGFMADEVQHWAARTCQVIADASTSAYYRYGLSATPWRDMGDDVLIDACFGKPICDITASFLIQRGYLIKPEILFLHVKNMRDCPYSAYHHIYQHAVKENPLRNEWIVKLTKKLQSTGREPLILVKHLDHGKLLNKMMEDCSTFVHGSLSVKKRKAHLDMMRAGKSPATIATNIFDEGVDVKRLDTIILAGCGKSATRALQRVGRVLRPFPSIENNTKKGALVIEFYDHVKYMDDHSDKRRSIYETEPEFVIKDIDL
jgi:superfamily II DNA or RNA helicase